MMLNRILVAAALVSAAALAHGQAPTPNDDFQQRCSAPGVTKCIGFDNTSEDIVPGVNLYPDSDGNYLGGLDANVKTSGGGSLRFDLPPPPHAGQNISGSWSPQSNDALGGEFGQNSTFYVQFRMRVTESMLNNTWNSFWKTVIFHRNQTTCGGIELATINRYLSGIMAMYTGCGSPSLFTTLDGTRETQNPPLLLQQGDYPCQYNQESAATCFYMPANEWVTFYYKVSIGDWDRRNSLVEAWIVREGSTEYEQFIRTPQLALSCNASNCQSGAGSAEAYNNITFTPYMTGLSRNSGRAGVTASIWYDELIVSTQPIAAPNAGPRSEPIGDLDAG